MEDGKLQLREPLIVGKVQVNENQVARELGWRELDPVEIFLGIPLIRDSLAAMESYTSEISSNKAGLPPVQGCRCFLDRVLLDQIVRGYRNG